MHLDNLSQQFSISFCVETFLQHYNILNFKFYTRVSSHCIKTFPGNRKHRLISGHVSDDFATSTGATVL